MADWHSMCDSELFSALDWQTADIDGVALLLHEFDQLDKDTRVAAHARFAGGLSTGGRASLETYLDSEFTPFIWTDGLRWIELTKAFPDYVYQPSARPLSDQIHPLIPWEAQPRLLSWLMARLVSI